jgi:hypothetical protein
VRGAVDAGGIINATPMTSRTRLFFWESSTVKTIGLTVLYRRSVLVIQRIGSMLQLMGRLLSFIRFNNPNGFEYSLHICNQIPVISTNPCGFVELPLITNALYLTAAKVSPSVISKNIPT